MNMNELIKQLSKRGLFLKSGLSDSELSAIEKEFGFIIPPDLRKLLQWIVPRNWHSISTLRKAIEWPWEGMAFDIEYNDFWHKSWGEKPTTLNEQLNVAKAFYDQYPQLIPIYSHRYMPATPVETGNPVFSVYQTDIIYYGYDLKSYLELELGLRTYDSLFSENHPFKHIDFWSDMVE